MKRILAGLLPLILLTCNCRQSAIAIKNEYTQPVKVITKTTERKLVVYGFGLVSDAVYEDQVILHEALINPGQMIEVNGVLAQVIVPIQQHTRIFELQTDSEVHRLGNFITINVNDEGQLVVASQVTAITRPLAAGEQPTYLHRLPHDLRVLLLLFLGAAVVKVMPQ